MRLLRVLLSDRLNGGMLAAILIYTLLAQSIAGGVASARMAGAQPHGASVICGTGGPSNHDHGANHRMDEGCAMLCQIACGLSTALFPGTEGTNLGAAHTSCLAAPAFALAPFRSPHQLGNCPEARGPPYFSA